MNQLQTKQTETFLLLVGLTLIGSLIALFISKIISSPITVLSEVTRELPDKISTREQSSWPNTPLQEINELTQNTKVMEQRLRDALLHLEIYNDELERVASRRASEVIKLSVQSQAIIKNAHEGIVSLDENGIIESANPACEKLFGYPHNELIGKDIQTLAHPDSCTINENFLNAEENIGHVINCLGRKKDGSKFSLEFLIARLTHVDRISFALFLHDVSEREKAEQIKDQFLSNISHELRTPLSAISGAVSIIRGMEADKLSEDGQHMLNISVANSDRLIHIVNDLLDMQKIIHEGGISYSITETELLPVITNAIETNRSLISSRGINVDSDFHVNNIFVMADSVRLEQAFVNLISNAIKFSKQGDTISISTSLHDNMVRITFADTGPGIPEDQYDNIFRRFSQVDGSDTRNHGGTGLGLNITKSIISHLGGNIWFDSELGKGTRFHVDLPYTKKDS